MLIDGLMASVTAIMLFVYSPKLAAVTIGFALLYAFLRVLYLKAYQDASQSQINLAAHQQGALIETLRGMQTIRLNNRMAQRSALHELDRRGDERVDRAAAAESRV